MKQISIFEALKPRIILLKDKTWINKKLAAGAEFEMLLETEEHYIIELDAIYYGIYKKECKII